MQCWNEEKQDAPLMVSLFNKYGSMPFKNRFDVGFWGVEV